MKTAREKSAFKSELNNSKLQINTHFIDKKNAETIAGMTKTTTFASAIERWPI